MLRRFLLTHCHAWDFWVGKSEQEVAMWVRHLAHKWGCRIDLHKMVAADAPGFFHTHPANAIRIVLSGGYVEEVVFQPHGRYRHDGVVTTDKFFCEPGHVGFIHPAYCHRIDRLLGGGPSFSLWLRGRITQDIFLAERGRNGLRWFKGSYRER